MTDTRTTALAALLLLGVGAFFFSPILQLPLFGAFFTVIGCVVFALLPFDSPAWTHQPNAVPYHVVRWRVGAFGAGALILLLAGISSTPDSGFLPSLTITAQMALFLTGLALIGGSAAHVRPMRVDAVLVAIVLLGVLVRVVDLGAQVHYFVDEMHFAEGVYHLRGDPYTPLFAPMNLSFAAFPWLYAYLQMLSAEVFGSTLGVLRLTSVVFGVLTIPTVYWLARTLFDRPTAWIAALMLATFPPHIHFSRLALNNIADPLFGVLALAFFARGIRQGGMSHYVLAGLSLGLTQYFYEGGQTVYPAVLLAWIVVALFRREICDLRLPAVTIVTALIVALPLVMTMLSYDMPYLPRLDARGFSGAFWTDSQGSYLADQLLPALAHIIYTPDGSTFYYGGGTALILPVLLPAFFAGCVAVIRRRSSGGASLILVIVATVVGNSFIDDPDWSARFVVALPALVILISVGLRDMGRFMIPAERGVAVYAAYTLVIVLAMGQVIYYMNPHITTYNRQIRPQRDHQDVLWRARDLPPETRVYLFTNEFAYTPHFQGMNRYWGTQIDVQIITDGTDAFAPPPDGVPLALFVNPQDVLTIVELGRMFDLPTPVFSPYNVPADRQYALFYVPDAVR